MDLNLAGITDSIKTLETQAAELQDKLDPFSGQKDGRIPFWSTGARSYIRMGGKPLAICTDIRWQVSYNGTPIHTIDTPHAWDIDVGQANIVATLNNIIDPSKGPEAYGLFSTMQSSVHQPMIELQVLDALGTSLFFARGMFLQVNGNITRGQLSGISASFTGIAYQHYVAQSFKPYSGVGGKISGLIGGLKDLVSKGTGGIF